MNEDKDYSYLRNRELSWLKFNERVLDEATASNVPLFEKLKFCAIYASNLDEFFMIRVGSINDMKVEKTDHIDSKSGMTDKEQLTAIYDEVARLNIKKDIIYKNLKSELNFNKIHLLDFAALDKEQKKVACHHFDTQVLPVLSPLIINSYHPFPHLINKRIYIIALLKIKGKISLGVVGVPRKAKRLIEVSENNFVFVENIIFRKCEELFNADEIIDKAIISITRNGDVNVTSEYLDEMEDYRDYMKKLVEKRKSLAPIRLEIQGSLNDKCKQQLLKILNLKENQVFEQVAPLDMSFVYSLAKRYEKSRPDLFYKPFNAPYPKSYNFDESMINQVLKKDMLLYYPYETTTPFLRLLKNAADDPRVESIKITLYRLANPSKVVECLCQASENGKSVTVLIELKARFDEKNNIDWAEVLEENGCNVMYGFDEYKVHSKICLITLKLNHHYRYIVQVATGNYNEKTAKLYTDLSLMTANQAIADDAHEFFNNMAQGSLDGDYKELLVAPYHLKDRLIAMIDEQIALKEDGYIFMKLNSLNDIDIINKFVEASQNGVRIDLVIRGICCLVPGVIGKSENIYIRSIIGRYLEHARIYVFGKKGQEKMYISSADMMKRNTENRVEVACPIYDKDVKDKIYTIIEYNLKDNVGARILGSDNEYHHVVDGKAHFNSQEKLMEWTLENAPKERPKAKNIFEKLLKKINKN